MRNYFRLITICTLCLVFLANISIAQDKKFPTPREETLLNGLKVLILTQPNSGRVSVKLRIHSGSAFDPKDKEGTMALLSDIIFPDQAIKTYFEEDLDGKLEIISTYDYIQINAVAKSAEFLAVMETLAPAVSSPQIDKETLEKIKPNRLEMFKEKENDASYTADRMIAERLYGEFPYGRPQTGTPESIAAIDFADLIFARQKFLTADNATLVISGDVNSNYAYKAARRLFGSWQKSLNKVPANFRLPEAPDETPLEINLDEGSDFQVRYAIETVSRKDTDFYASEILAEILNSRFKKLSEKDRGLKSIAVNNQANLLRGYMIFSKQYDADKAPAELTINESKVDAKPNQQIKKMLAEKITKAEFDRAKGVILSSFNKQNPSDFWLNSATYKLGSMAEELNKADKISMQNVQKIALDLSKNKVAYVEVLQIDKRLIPDEVLEKDPKDPK